MVTVPSAPRYARQARFEPGFLSTRSANPLAGIAGFAGSTLFALANHSPASSLFGRVSVAQTGQQERRIFAGFKLLW